MYSVEITVERDRVTGETKVLSTNTKLPVDVSQQGVVVYEDEQKGENKREREHEPRGTTNVCACVSVSVSLCV